jgi:hypothetical protein
VYGHYKFVATDLSEFIVAMVRYTRWGSDEILAGTCSSRFKLIMTIFDTSRDYRGPGFLAHLQTGIREAATARHRQCGVYRGASASFRGRPLYETGYEARDRLMRTHLLQLVRSPVIWLRDEYMAFSEDTEKQIRELAPYFLE